MYMMIYIYMPSLSHSRLALKHPTDKDGQLVYREIDKEYNGILLYHCG